MSEHTELPWEYCPTMRAVVHRKLPKPVHIILRDAHILNHRDREFIVTACNWHYSLLEVLQDIIRAAGALRKEGEADGLSHDPDCVMCAALRRGEAAIAGATHDR